MSVTTTGSLSGEKLLLCWSCKQRKALLVGREGNRQVCVECLPADERKVFEQPKKS